MWSLLHVHEHISKKGRKTLTSLCFGTFSSWFWHRVPLRSKKNSVPCLRPFFLPRDQSSVGEISLRSYEQQASVTRGVPAVDGWNPAETPVEVGSFPIIYRVSYMPGGARFQPSTVLLSLGWCRWWFLKDIHEFCHASCITRRLATCITTPSKMKRLPAASFWKDEWDWTSKACGTQLGPPRAGLSWLYHSPRFASWGPSFFRAALYSISVNKLPSVPIILEAFDIHRWSNTYRCCLS